MTHTMHLQKRPFQKIWKGQKTIELRLYDEKRRAIKTGDRIVFSNEANPEQCITVQVTALHVFASFEQLYAALPLTACGYDRRQAKRASATDMNAYYSEEQQALWGVVGIAFDVIEKADVGRVTMGCHLSRILRHDLSAAGIELDRNGWADVAQLLDGVNTHYTPDNMERFFPLTIEQLKEIVETDDKERYCFDEQNGRIRANQGHTIDVDVELKECVPPPYLWHGTAQKYAGSIDENGLLSQKRLYVHLSETLETAIKVGTRHGAPLVYRVNTQQMHEDGFTFFLSKNRVWLVKHVPAVYLQKQEEKES